MLRDLITTSTTENVYLRILPDLARAAAVTGTVISLGATFRSANIFDSYDTAQRLEIAAQLDLARQLQSAGVDVIIEGPGHASPSDISRIAALLKPSAFPVMPLGPIPTESAVGLDHISAAIGATLFGLAGCAHVLAAVTREEHTGGVPSTASTLEAIEAAHVAARIIDLELLHEEGSDRAVAMRRAELRSCVTDSASRGCSRCAALCPL